MKILFFDVKDNERDFILENVLKGTEIVLFSEAFSFDILDKKFLDCEAISVFVNSTLNEEVLSKFCNLKYIFLRCSGYSNVDLNYCKKNNILVYNVPNYASYTVSEFAFALLLSLVKKINENVISIKNANINSCDLIGEELFQKTIGIIGMGSIGKRVASISEGFGMNHLAFDIKTSDKYNYVSLDMLLKKSDYIILTCPLNEKTKGMIAKKEFELMKNTAVLVNVARGEIVNLEDLYYALINKKIKACALDVIECEEILCQSYDKCLKISEVKHNCLKKYLFAQKLTSMPNVIITPHNAYNTFEAQKRILETTKFNIAQTLNIKAGTKNLVLI